MQTLTGRTCIFSGASGGDGVAAVKALCAGGMNVVMMTHRLKEAEELAEEINASGVPGFCMCVTGEGKEAAESREEVLKNINERFGSIDVVISNIGADGYGIELQEVTRELLMKSMDHLVGGGFEMMKNALPYLKQSRAPRVIFMTTVEGRYGGTHESYINAIAKGGVLSMALNSAARLGRYGITVNCISKGAVKREGYIRPDAPKPEELLSRIPVGRIGTPEDLAQAVCYLASEETGYITGQVLNVCGGLCMG